MAEIDPFHMHHALQECWRWTIPEFGVQIGEEWFNGLKPLMSESIFTRPRGAMARARFI